MRRVVRATEAYRRVTSEVMGIGLTETITASELHYHGPLTPSVLAERLGLTSASVTAVIDRLTGLGLVTRRRHPDDRRSVIVELTEAGAEKLSAMVDMFTADIREGIREAGPAHVEELDRLLEQVATHLEERTAERSGMADLLEPFALPARTAAARPPGPPPPGEPDLR
jgi:DNA-binding MarR family transcriptional regulator